MSGRGGGKLAPTFDMPDLASTGAIVLAQAMHFGNKEGLTVNVFDANTNQMIASNVNNPVTTDRNGYAAVEIPIPSNWAGGILVFSCIGLKSRKSAADTMQVVATYQTSITLSNQNPLVGEEVRIGCAGFAPNENLTATILQPSGTNLTLGPIMTDGSGIAVFGFTPQVAGMYGVTVIGPISQTQATAQFLAS